MKLRECNPQLLGDCADCITKCPSSSKKRKIDSKWCLEALAQKFDIDVLDTSAGVLKEHVAHMETVAHLFKHHSVELKAGNFKDAGLVPMVKKRKREEDEENARKTKIRLQDEEKEKAKK